MPHQLRPAGAGAGQDHDPICPDDATGGCSARCGLQVLLSLAVVAIAACTVRIEFASPRAVTGDLAAISSGLAGHEQGLFELPAAAEPAPETGIEVASLAPSGGALQLWPRVGDRRPAAAAPAMAGLPQPVVGPTVAAPAWPVISPSPPRPSRSEPAAPPTALAVLPPPPKPVWLLAFAERLRPANDGGRGRRAEPQIVLAPRLELALPAQRYDLQWLSALTDRPDLIKPAAGPLPERRTRREPAVARGDPIRLFPIVMDQGF